MAWEASTTLGGAPSRRLAARRMCKTQRPGTASAMHRDEEGPEPAAAKGDEEGADGSRTLAQSLLWLVLGAYVAWLILLPFAPGDPVWAIKPETVRDLVDLSVNFFFVLPVANLLGWHGVEAPVLHPTDEALFNLVNAWSFMFGPLLVADSRRIRFRGASVELLWAFQMFLTNVFLIPYMALRLGEPASVEASTNLPMQTSAREYGLVEGILARYSTIIGLVGGGVGLLSLVWAIRGRPGEDFGGTVERWQYFLQYLSTERLAYALIWDMVLYSFFQGWLVADNARSRQADEGMTWMKSLSYIPFFGLAAYLVFRSKEEMIRSP